ncbi:hypothetical protein GBAR_LOCUS24293, partial [Geodia barretti]
ILSPFLYSIYVNDLLHQLSGSGYGATIDGNFCGSPMYADDLALIANSSSDLQAMLEIVFSYSVQWRYQLNAQKSAIQIFGESAATRARNRPSRQWIIGSEVIPEKDSYHHLGILRSVSHSSNARTSERCSSSRRAFFSLNGLGSRAGCLHPLTSLRLYKAELMLLERTHR